MMSASVVRLPLSGQKASAGVGLSRSNAGRIFLQWQPFIFFVSRVVSPSFQSPGVVERLDKFAVEGADVFMCNCPAAIQVASQLAMPVPPSGETPPSSDSSQAPRKGHRAATRASKSGPVLLVLLA